MIYEYKEAASKILEAGNKLLERGLVARTWGNISARISDKEFLITPSGKAYEHLTEADLVRVAIKNLAWEGDVKPSSEKALHAGLYRQRPDVGAIIHTHQSHASALSVLGKDLDLVRLTRERGLDGEMLVSYDDVMLLGTEVPCAKYALSSTKQLASHVIHAASEHPAAKAVLMRKHGAVCMGIGMNEAFTIAETLEDICGRIYERRCMQKLPSGNDPEAVTQLNTHDPLDADYNLDPEDAYVVLHVRTPFVMEMSRRGKSVPSYLDDAAQLFGKALECVADVRDADAVLEVAPAVLVSRDGALCKGTDRYEAEAAAMVLEKNCQAAMIGLKKAAPPVGQLSAAIEHRFYIRKYAKRR